MISVKRNLKNQSQRSGQSKGRFLVTDSKYICNISILDENGN